MPKKSREVLLGMLLELELKKHGQVTTVTRQHRLGWLGGHTVSIREKGLFVPQGAQRQAAQDALALLGKMEAIWGDSPTEPRTKAQAKEKKVPDAATAPIDDQVVGVLLNYGFSKREINLRVPAGPDGKPAMSIEEQVRYCLQRLEK